MTNIHSSGNDIVDGVGKMRFTGNVIPTIWNKTIIKDNEKPHWLAIIMLADIVYWYRPTEIRDEQTGELIGFKKKFERDLLQRSYQQLSDQFGISKREAQRTVVFLEDLGVIKRELRTISANGTTLNNVLYLELIVEKLKDITYPDETLLPNLVPPVTKSGKRVLPKQVTPVTKSGKTNTETTTETTTDILSVNQSISKDINNIDKNNDGLIDKKHKDKIELYEKIIKENIDYEHLKNNTRHSIKDIDNLVNLIIDICVQESGTVNINKNQVFVEIVKSNFFKITSEHIVYILESLNNNPSKIKNIRNYLLTTIYNSVNTIDQYYRGRVNHDMCEHGKYG